jgi:hypothetical protein
MHAHARAHRRHPTVRTFRSLRAAVLGATVAVGSTTALPVRAGATPPATAVIAVRDDAPSALAPAALGFVPSSPTGTASAPPSTASYYEYGADPGVLAGQGEAAGKASSQGFVILDFGRPASDGSSDGTMDHGGHFVSLAAIENAVESYVQAYYTFSPPHTHLDVAVGTNNSCSTGQPCGAVTCGCRDEPPSFVTWGAHLASSVKRLETWTTNFKARSGYTDDVKVVAADDAEPAYDPGYRNTYDVLRGYADAVGGFQPALVDYGSAEPGFWSAEQLFQVAYGFRPDLPFPQIYYPSDVANWTSLIDYAQAQHGVAISIFGLLTDMPIGNSPQSAYEQITNAIRPLTGQAGIRWSSNIAPLTSS